MGQLKTTWIRILLCSGILLLWCLLIWRTTGIHSDEVNYLRLSDRYLWGDSYNSHKPSLFYVLNYLFMHSVGFILGPLRAWFLYLLYSSLSVAGVMWAILPLYSPTHKFSWCIIFIFLLSSPLFVLNSTQLMMETPLLFLISFIFGIMVRPQRFRALLILGGAIAVALKTTAIPALLILGATYFEKQKPKVKDLGIGIALGLLLTQILSFIGHLFPTDLGFQAVDYQRSFSDYLDIEENLRHLKMTSFFLYTWLFFVGAPLVGLLWKPKQVEPYLGVLIGSWAGTFLIQMTTTFFYVRYTYPILWTGLLGGVYLLRQAPSWLLISLVSLTSWQSLPLFTGNDYRFEAWPTLVRAEFFEAPLTLFHGAPTHRILSQLRLQTKDPCLELHLPPQSRLTGWYQRYWQFIFPHFDPRSTCTNPQLQVWRETSPCSQHCKRTTNYCSLQEIQFPDATEETQYWNEICW